MLRKLMMCALAGALLCLPVYAQTVDEIIAKNVEARGGKDKLKSIQSVKITGRMTLGPDGEAPFVWKWKRPSMLRMEFTVQGMTGIQAFDGKGGWMVMPFLGKKDPEAMSDDDIKEVEDQADFEGPLVNYKEKGNQVELAGKESIEGTEAYKIKLTRKSGDVSYIYLDSGAYLEIKEEGKRKLHGQEIEYESSSGDYKDIGGVMIAHSIESKPKGAPAGQTITFDKIEMNVDLPDAEFKMPEVKKTEAGQ